MAPFSTFGKSKICTNIFNIYLFLPISIIANFVTFITFAIIAYYIFRDPITTEGKEAVGDLKKFPLFFGTVLFALEAIGVVSW